MAWIGALLAVAAAGCARSEPSAGRNLLNVVQIGLAAKPVSVESTSRLTPEEQQERVMLSRSEQRAARAAMRVVADGHEPTARARPAEHGVRWRDVPHAVRLVCMVDDRRPHEAIEMAIARIHRERDERGEVIAYRFELSTIDERPAELIVRRVDDERVYEAHATVGRFENDAARAQRLVEAFHRNMRELGQKRGFD